MLCRGKRYSRSRSRPSGRRHRCAANSQQIATESEEKACPAVHLVRDGRLDSQLSCSQRARLNFFCSFIMVFLFSLCFDYFLAVFSAALSGSSGAVCGHLCGQKRFPPQIGDFSPVQDGKRFAFQVGWVITLNKELFKCFLPKAQLKVCGAIDKEIGKFKHQVYFGLISTIAESAPNSSESSSTDIPLICPSLV